MFVVHCLFLLEIVAKKLCGLLHIFPQLAIGVTPVLTTNGNTLTTVFYELYSYENSNMEYLIARSGATVNAGGLAVDAGTVKLPGACVTLARVASGCAMA
jgi:hypothetical protein